MTGVEVGLASIVVILLLIYLGVHVAIALCAVSLLGVIIMRGKVEIALQLLTQAANNSIAEYAFGVIPLFVLMGIIVAHADIGKDSYRVAHQLLGNLRGGIGLSTVGANAVFAATTGVSIASVAVFTRIAVPEMLRFGYAPRFAVGIVAGSSVLGMLIPPSVLLIVYGLTTDTSVGDLFMAGIGPGLLLTAGFCLYVYLVAVFRPEQAGGGIRLADAAPAASGWHEALRGLAPIVVLIVGVLGGIYGGFVTPTEAGALGAAITLIIATVRRKLTFGRFWTILVETGHITASVLFLIIAASMYSRMLGVTGLPTRLGDLLEHLHLGYWGLLTLYILVLLAFGTMLDSISTLLVVVPLFLPVFLPFGIDQVWFGIISVVAIEIGLLTPPFGMSVFVLKSTLTDPSISLKDVFMGALPFAGVMFAVLLILIAVPWISLALVT